MPTTCIDLKARFGRRYRVRYEESYRADKGAAARAPDPWLLTILCRNGHIFPHGGETLAASTDTRRGPAVAALRRLGCCRVHQDGSDGVTFLFDVADFAAVAAIMQPRRRRQMTEAQKAVCAERLARVRPTPLRSTGITSARRDGSHPVDTLPVPTA